MREGRGRTKAEKERGGKGRERDRGLRGGETARERDEIPTKKL